MGLQFSTTWSILTLHTITLARTYHKIQILYVSPHWAFLSLICPSVPVSVPLSLCP